MYYDKMFFFLMIRLPPRSTRTDTLFPYTTLFRSPVSRRASLIAATASSKSDGEPLIAQTPPHRADHACCVEHPPSNRSEEHTSELQSLMRISYAVFCLKKKKKYKIQLESKEAHIQL